MRGIGRTAIMPLVGAASLAGAARTVAARRLGRGRSEEERGVEERGVDAAHETSEGEGSGSTAAPTEGPGSLAPNGDGVEAVAGGAAYGSPVYESVPSAALLTSDPVPSPLHPPLHPPLQLLGGYEIEIESEIESEDATGGVAAAGAHHQAKSCEQALVALTIEPVGERELSVALRFPKSAC